MLKWINMFPTKGGVSKRYNLSEILAAKPMDSKKYNKPRFGSYGQATHETNPTNPTITRKLGVIYIRSLYMLQGGFEVINGYNKKYNILSQGYSNSNNSKRH